MRHSRFIIVLLMAPLFLTGCAGYAYQTGVAFETVHHQTPRTSRFYNRVDQDARGYVRYLDRYLRLNKHQERRINQVLQNRTYDLLDRTRIAEHRAVYPFPRHDGPRAPRITQRWWQQTDNRIESVLNRRQRREYRSLVNDDRYDRRDGRYRDRDDVRYDNRRRRG